MGDKWSWRSALGLPQEIRELRASAGSVKNDLQRRLTDVEKRINALDLQAYALSALTSDTPGVQPRETGPKLTVSLTSYGRRAREVYLVVESLMLQSVRADRILLWLSREEFRPRDVPELLKRQEDRGLVVDFCDDLRSYKKLIPTLRRHPEDLILTVDDDILYPVDHVERLYRAHQDAPGVIHCGGGHRMTTAEDGSVLPYEAWDKDVELSEPSLDVVPVGASGILYFPGCFHEEVLDRDAFLRLAPRADDLWFKVMSRRRGTPCQVLPHGPRMATYRTIPGSHEGALWRTNIRDNDTQLRALLEAYPDLGLQMQGFSGGG